jgi:hypothetical protein
MARHATVVRPGGPIDRGLLRSLSRAAREHRVSEDIADTIGQTPRLNRSDGGPAEDTIEPVCADLGRIGHGRISARTTLNSTTGHHGGADPEGMPMVST